MKGLINFQQEVTVSYAVSLSQAFYYRIVSIVSSGIHPICTLLLYYIHSGGN